MQIFALAFLVATVSAIECCDVVRHEAFAQQAELTKLCTARGGIPITDLVVDEGTHAFQILRQCAFPCDQRLTVER